MTSSEKKHAAWVDVVAGGCGGALAKSLLSPFQRIVVLQQLGQHKGYSVLQLAQYSQCKFLLQDWLQRRRQERAASGGLQDSCKVELMEKFIMKCGAGGISATIAGAAVYPGEVVRLRLMSGEKEFHGIFHTCRVVYGETNSLRNFYRGLGASLMQRVPDILVSFATYETIKYAVLDSPNPFLFKDNFTARNLLSTILGGSAAAIASIAVAFPLDVAKRRIGMSGRSTDGIVYRGVADCLRSIYAKEGIRGWYAGSFVEAVRCVPQVILMWLFIESIQKHLSPYAAVVDDSSAEAK